MVNPSPFQLFLVTIILATYFFGVYAIVRAAYRQQSRTPLRHKKPQPKPKFRPTLEASSQPEKRLPFQGISQKMKEDEKNE